MKNNFLLTGILIVAMYSCTSNGKEPKETKTDTPAKATVVTTDTIPKAVTPAVKDEGFLKDEAIGDLSLGADMFFVNKILGPWDSESEPEIWEVDGDEHKSLTYESGMTIDMAGKSDNYVINSVKITAPSELTTRKGIKIGSTIQEVIAAYNKHIEKPITDSSVIVAGSVYEGLVFTIEKGKVASIFMGASAE